MNDTLQTILIIAAVLAAVLYLALRRRKKKSCGDGGCGCGTAKAAKPGSEKSNTPPF